MFSCCCNRAKDDVLLTTNDVKRNERVIVSSRTSSTSNKDRTDDDSVYEPPHLPDPDVLQRLSLPYCPAQKEGKKISIGKHRKKAGYVRKKGHLVKNWKKRYLVLKGRAMDDSYSSLNVDGLLTYYGSSNPSKKDENGFDEGYT